MHGIADTLGGLIPIIGLVSIRVAVAFQSLPQPFSKLSPPPFRAALSLILATTAVLPRIGTLPHFDGSPISLLQAVGGEVLVGAVIGLTVRVTLAAAEIAGTIAGFSMGLGFATSVDPNYGEQVLPPTRLLGALATLIFLILQGHHTLINALGRSLDVAPPGEVVVAAMSVGVVKVGGQMLARGLQVAGPVMATMFIVQLGTAFAAKAAPKVNLFVLVFGVASATGMLTIFVAAPSLATAISVQMRALPAALAAILGGP